MCQGVLGPVCDRCKGEGFNLCHLQVNRITSLNNGGGDDRHLVLRSPTRLATILFSASLSIIQLNLYPQHIGLHPLSRGALAPAAARGYPGFVVIGAQPVRCRHWPPRQQQDAATPGVGDRRSASLAAVGPDGSQAENPCWLEGCSGLRRGAISPAPRGEDQPAVLS